MKILINFLFVFICQNLLHGQVESNLKLIDSLHKEYKSIKTKDSLSTADYYYNLGETYRYSNIGDSAYYYYYKAEKIYKYIKNDLRLARTLYGLAVMQNHNKDFTGAEVTAFESLSLLESLREENLVRKYKGYNYNLLGMVYEFMGQFDQAIDYYETSIELKKKLIGDNKLTMYNSLNNLAGAYKAAKKYDIAQTKFSQILNEENFLKDFPDLYVTALDNYAHTLYLADKKELLPNLFFTALRMADSLEIRNYRSIIINQHLAEYYKNEGSKDSALYYARKAYDISKDYFNDDILKSLKILAQVETGDKAVRYLQDYIELSDSVHSAERATRNKYERIRFETDQIEQENIRISRERSWLIVISLSILIISIFIYMLIVQRNKNRELQFVQEQQEANEEIYNLMLSQNESIEEARTIEKKRISQELHDGVLGRLFGTRLSLDSLNFNNTPEAIRARANYISQLKTIEEDIRKVSHELNTDFVAGGGFIDIIKTMVETQCLAYKLNFDLKQDDDINWDEIPNKTKIHLYRILQESLHNIHKHANASHVKIRFRLKNNVICLSIADNGSGFDVSKSKSGIGLKNMKSRLAEIGGQIEINSQIDKGTKVEVLVPFV